MLGSQAMPIPGCGATRAPACAPPCRPAPAGAVAVVQSAQRATLGAPAGRNNRGARGAQGRTRSARFACGAAAVENEFAVMDGEAEDFYQLLGVVGHPPARLSTQCDVRREVGALGLMLASGTPASACTASDGFVVAHTD